MFYQRPAQEGNSLYEFEDNDGDTCSIEFYGLDYEEGCGLIELGIWNATGYAVLSPEQAIDLAHKILEETQPPQEPFVMELSQSDFKAIVASAAKSLSEESPAKDVYNRKLRVGNVLFVEKPETA